MNRVTELRRHLDWAGRLPSPLDLERGCATFPVKELANAIHGGPRAVEVRRRIMAMVARDPILRTSSAVVDMSREEERLASSASSDCYILAARSPHESA